MPLVSRHDPGWPCWIEVVTPEPEESVRFYRELFGWDSYTLTLAGRDDVEIFTLGGIQGPEVGAVRALADPAQPVSWSCVFRSDDIEATVAAVRAAGGQVMIEPADMADLGHFAHCADTEWADFGLWKPYNLAGVGVVDEPSAPCWIELASRDIEGARRFYEKVFGWRAVDRDYYATRYTEFKVEGQSVAGMVDMDELWPPDHPPHWTPYFEVADCDAAAERATGLGAKIRVPPSDIAPGRFSIMTDPVGARLAIITPDPEVRMGFRLRP
jgi:predicted enzyme related to lactoylglutathione lyase